MAVRLELLALKDTARGTYRALDAAYGDGRLNRAARLEAWILQKAIYGLVRRLEDFERTLEKEHLL